MLDDIPKSVGGLFAIVSSFFVTLMYHINNKGWFNKILRSVFGTHKVTDELKKLVKFITSYRGLVY